MSTDLDVFLKRLHLANARRIWQDLVQRAEKEQWSHRQLLYTLLEEEVAHRRGTRLNRAVHAAKFPFLRTVEEYDFSYQSTLRLTTIGSLLAPDFVTEGNSVILLGKPGRDFNRIQGVAERIRCPLHDSRGTDRPSLRSESRRQDA